MPDRTWDVLSAMMVMQNGICASLPSQGLYTNKKIPYDPCILSGKLVCCETSRQSSMLRLWGF